MWKTIAVVSFSATLSVATVSLSTNSVSQQELELLRGADAPPDARWIDSLDLRSASRREGGLR